MHERFAEERARLGYASAHALASALGVAHSSVRRAERGENVPGGELLAAFAKAGADVSYVLTGQRQRIDLQLLGMCEAALRYAYERLRATPMPGSIRSRVTATLYNQALVQLGPDAADDARLNELAGMLLDGYNDPGNPGMLEANLFGTAQPSAAAGTTTVNVSGGKGQRIAGRDFVQVKPKD